ncbi:MAG: AAA family ATPase [Planctomycetes bacterium]|nr:AAA family ATPase [Planctomycetota bacterium]
MDELVVLSGSQKGNRFPLDLDRWKVSELIVGRSKASHILLVDTKVSKQHCRLYREGGRWFIEDLGSRNGLFLNGERIEREALSPDDEIRIGNFVLRFAGGGASSPEGAGAQPTAARQTSRVSRVSMALSSAPSAADDTAALHPVTEALDGGAGSSEEVRAMVAAVHEARERVRREIAKVVVGQEGVIREVLIGLLACGHCLLEGVPGLAKTLLVSTLAEVLDLDFKRIQFTPDLMPSDITGTEVLEEEPGTRKRIYKFIQGPIFTNILLADEINRTPPKTQAALLEAMQEFKVTAAGTTYSLTPPFYVLATQNPLEQEGTYPLPEAQLDRFMLKIRVDYPSRDEEIEILRATTTGSEQEPDTVLSAGQILKLQKLTRKLPVSDYILGYATDLARATRPAGGEAPEFIRKYVSWGAGPRAAQYLTLGAKAGALLDGRVNVTAADVRSVAPSVLRHRIGLNFHAASDGRSSDELIQQLLDVLPEPRLSTRRSRS